MEKQTLGQKIAELRKAKNMTQLELANQLNITDKAVSKWERDISCPDINTFPKLAEILGVSVDELLQANASEKENKEKNEAFLPFPPPMPCLPAESIPWKSPSVPPALPMPSRL